MIGYLLLVQVFGVVVQARPNHFSEIMSRMENDANLNEGFDIDAFRLNQLNLHNYYRSLHTDLPAMTRSATLEAEAQTYAETLASQDIGLHHCTSQDCNSHGAGENLARAWGSTGAETNATKGWYDEIWDYNYCHGESNFRRPGHESKAIGHFTQVVWKASTQLGIGYARTADKTGVYVVGRYLEHGNYGGQFAVNVPKADYLFNTFQDNCNAVNGGFSAWSAPSECSRSCGGGVQTQSRTCTNPKPSLNGADCDGASKQLASQEWCNIESCPGESNHRDEQCEARGHPAQSYVSNKECLLYCYSGSGILYNPAGTVDDGTHCNSGSGACVEGVCQEMPQYAAPTTPPPTNAAGDITGSYTETPSSDFWERMIFLIPNGATNIVMKNFDYNNDQMMMGYKVQTSGGTSASINWIESWNQGFTIQGVSGTYQRVGGYSQITIQGPVSLDPGVQLVLYVTGSVPAQIHWSYSMSSVV